MQFINAWLDTFLNKPVEFNGDRQKQNKQKNKIKQLKMSHCCFGF